MAQHLVVSCFIMRMPESAISKLVREVGEKWEDAHGRLMVKVLGHAAVGLEPQWTNDSKSMNKVENKACSGRVCKCARLGRPTCALLTVTIVSSSVLAGLICGAASTRTRPRSCCPRRVGGLSPRASASRPLRGMVL